MRPHHLLPLAVLAACANPAPDTLFTTLQSQCGKTLSGTVVSDQAVDADWIGQPLTLGPIDCTGEGVTPDMPAVSGPSITMPLAVGEDRSRVWLLRPVEAGLEFRHFHYEPDGSPSAVTSYGGVDPAPTATRLQIATDAATQANFRDNGIARSVPNIWTLALDGDTLTYALARPATETDVARDFRAAFALD